MRKSILILTALAVIIGIAGFWYYQKNIYSKDIIKLEISGPDKADLGEEVEYIVKYRNNGDVRVDNPELIFEFPEYSIVKEGESLRQILGPEELGEAIYPAEQKTFTFKGRLLGKENEVKTAKVSLTYQAKNLKPKYESSNEVTTQISKIPLTFYFDIPSRIEAEKEVTFRLNYFSNADYPFSDLRAKITYPPSFEFIDSEPTALEQNEWDIPLLNKAEGGRIEVTGKVSGDVGQQRSFQAELGMWLENEFIPLKKALHTVEIIEPSLFVSQQINGNPEYIASPGDLLHYEIFFKNIGDKPLVDLFLAAKLEGKALDLQSIKAPLGDFNLGDRTIVFDQRKISKLKFLNTREEGMVEFWINVKDEWGYSGSGDENPIIKNKVYLNQSREFVTKVNTRLAINQKGYFQDEIFGNSGSIPPKVDQTTTYTIMWHPKNYYSHTKNVKVKAVLPSNVKLTGKFFPEEQETKFSFDSASRQIVWDVGELEAGQGVFDQKPAPNISFQIEFKPNNSQKSKTPDIIQEVEILGEDSWTQQIISFKGSAINTTLPDDDTINGKDGIVQ